MRMNIQVRTEGRPDYEVSRDISDCDVEEFYYPPVPDAFTFGGNGNEFQLRMMTYSRQLEKHKQFRDMLAADFAMALSRVLTRPESGRRV